VSASHAKRREAEWKQDVEKFRLKRLPNKNQLVI
jgi:hypothetical protein